MRITNTLYQYQKSDIFTLNKKPSNNINFRANYNFINSTQKVVCEKNNLTVGSNFFQKLATKSKAKLMAFFASSILSILIKNLLNPKKIFQGSQEPLLLDKNISFKKLNTIEEAISFAKEKFKIENYYTDDIEIANWVNEALCNINNKFEGRVYMPKNLIITDTSLFKNDAGYYQSTFDTLVINTDVIKKNIARIQNVDSTWINTTRYLLTHPIGTKSDEFETIASKYLRNPNLLSNMEKQALHFSICKQVDVIKNNKGNKILDNVLNVGCKPQKDYFGQVNFNKFGLIYHEMGHVFMDKAMKMNIDLIDKFNSAKHKFPLRQHAKSNYREFCADIFSGLMNGDIYPQTYLDYFEKLTNIKFPCGKQVK